MPRGCAVDANRKGDRSREAGSRSCGEDLLHKPGRLCLVERTSQLAADSYTLSGPNSSTKRRDIARTRNKWTDGFGRLLVSLPGMARPRARRRLGRFAPLQASLVGPTPTHFARVRQSLLILLHQPTQLPYEPVAIATTQPLVPHDPPAISDTKCGPTPSSKAFPSALTLPSPAQRRVPWPPRLGCECLTRV